MKLPSLHISHRTRRGITLASAILVALSAGTNYVFSAYGAQLANRLHLSSTALNGVALCGNAGMYATGPFAGRFIDARGPRTALSGAALLLLVGYGIVYGSYEAPGDDEAPPASAAAIAVLAFGMFCTGTGSSAALSGAANGVAKSFGPRRRATVIAATLAGFGLSAFLWATLAHLLFAENTGDFLLLLSLGTATCIGIGAVGVKPIPPGQRRRQAQGYARIPAEESPKQPRPSLPKTGVNALPSPGLDEQEGREVRGPPEPPKQEPKELDIHGSALFKSLDFPVLLIVMGCLSGTGLMLINNVGTIISTLYTFRRSDIVEPLLAKPKTVAQLQAAQVSLLSVFNCVGRLFAGVCSDFLKSRFGMNRGWYLAILASVFVVSQLVGLVGVEVEEDVWLLVVLTGFAYGNLFGTVPVLVLEWFGVHSFSTNFGITNLAVLSGQMSNVAFGRIYDSHVPAPSDHPDEKHQHTCPEGTACFRGAFKMTLAACCLALGLSVFAGWRRGRMEAKEALVEYDRDEGGSAERGRAAGRPSLEAPDGTGSRRARRSFSLGAETGGAIAPALWDESEAEGESENET